MRNTKDKILITALNLFAAQGFEAVSVSDIAGRLGITKGALYKHYRDKQDILDSIIREMERRDAENAADFDLPEGTIDEMPEKYREIALNRFSEYSRAQLKYWTEDPFAADFRKMLTVEQFGGKYGHLYAQYLSAGPVGYITDIFTALGIAEPYEKAVAYYSNMFLLYSLYDLAEDKKKALETGDKLLSEQRLYQIIKGE